MLRLVFDDRRDKLNGGTIHVTAETSMKPHRPLGISDGLYQLVSPSLDHCSITCLLCVSIQPTHIPATPSMSSRPLAFEPVKDSLDDDSEYWNEFAEKLDNPDKYKILMKDIGKMGSDITSLNISFHKIVLSLDDIENSAGDVIPDIKNLVPEMRSSWEELRKERFFTFNLWSRHAETRI